MPHHVPMFPFKLWGVRVHTSRETSAHKKTWSTHKRSFKKCFCTYFIQVVPNTGGVQVKFNVHIDFDKFEGTLVTYNQNLYDKTLRTKGSQWKQRQTRFYKLFRPT